MPAVLMSMAVVAAAVAAIGASRRAAAAAVDASVPPPSVAAWRVYVEPFASAVGLPIAFVLRWITVESGGNPCAVGSATAKGPDGNPQELSLGQLYNPDDLRRLGVTGDQLRAGCSRTSVQRLTRELTEDEKTTHARATVQLITHCRDQADAVLAAAGADWSARDRYATALGRLRGSLRLDRETTHRLGLRCGSLPAVDGVALRRPLEPAAFDALRKSPRQARPSTDCERALRCASAHRPLVGRRLVLRRRAGGSILG